MKMNTKILGATALASGLLAASTLTFASGPDILSAEPIFRSQTAPVEQTVVQTVVSEKVVVTAPPAVIQPESNFTVTFNGRAALMLGYHTGELTGAPATAGGVSNLGVSDSAGLTGGVLSLDPTQGEEDYWSMSSNYTRFGFTATGDTALGAFTARVEGDFNGSGVGSVSDTDADSNFDTFTPSTDLFRLRHAYGEVGAILAGQTWSLYSDGHPYVSYWDWTGDTVSPGNNLSRRLQLRYSFEAAPGVSGALAIEEPTRTVDPEFFDITGNLKFAAGPAKVTVSGIYAFSDDGTKNGGFAAAASAQFNLGPMDAAIVGMYSDDSHVGLHSGSPLAQIADETWGVGGSLSGDVSKDMGWYAGGSYATKRDFQDFEVYYATAALEWSPMPQYTVTGQVVYEKIDRSVAGQEADALSFLNYWIYKF